MSTRTDAKLSRDQLEAFLDASPDAVVIADAAGTMVFVNGEAEKLFGYRRSELLGQPVEMLIPGAARTEHAASRDRYFASPRRRPMGSGIELFGLRRDGTEFPAEISLSPVQTAAGPYVSSTIRDLSDQKRIEAQLIETKQAAERASQAKSRFLATASHDLRQPMQTLSMLNSALGRTVRDEQSRRAVALQGQALGAMSDLLDALLDISKLETGVIEPDIADCALATICERLCAEFAGEAEAKGLELLVTSGADVVRTDSTLLEQVLQNLLANAIRYTQQGRVHLRCISEADHVRIEVLDTGSGIPSEELEAIFDEFYRVPQTSAQPAGGLGLGLSIVRRLADLLEHPLLVESTPGAGSCFAVRVPKGDPSAVAGMAAKPAEEETAASGALILIVDDDEEVAAATSLLLEIVGYRTLTAADAVSARERLAGTVPQAVICDFHLRRGETGVDAIRGIRAAARSQVPAILVTGDTSGSVAEHLEGLEGCRLLSKPVDTDELLRLLHGMA